MTVFSANFVRWAGYSFVPSSATHGFSWSIHHESGPAKAAARVSISAWWASGTSIRFPQLPMSIRLDSVSLQIGILFLVLRIVDLKTSLQILDVFRRRICQRVKAFVAWIRKIFQTTCQSSNENSRRFRRLVSMPILLSQSNICIQF